MGVRGLAPVVPAARIGLATLAAVALLGCGTSGSAGAGSSPRPDALSPQGRGARLIAREWWLNLTLASVVSLIVFALLAAVIVRHRRRGPRPGASPGRHDDEGDRAGMRWVVLGGVAMPGVVLTGVFAFSMWNMYDLNQRAGEPILRVEVTGHRWWWEVTYPDHGVVTANHLPIPVGVPVQIDLLADDVIHSFWVPQIDRKLDAIPGRVNSIVITAEATGSFRGLCAEFCGLQHANMQFELVAMSDDAFAAWLERAGRDVAPPGSTTLQLGHDTFMQRGCANCHTRRGTGAAGSVGPDLSDLADRQTLGSGILPNTPGHLAAWIADPHGAKPGVHMPATALSGPELTALVEYLGHRP